MALKCFYEITLSNFSSTDFPITFTVHPEGLDPYTEAFSQNGTYIVPQGTLVPSFGQYTFDANASGTGEIPFQVETVVLMKDMPWPQPIPSSNRYIRVIIRNFPIDDGELE